MYISIGSNLGDRLGNCRKALSAISGFAGVTVVSSVYETEPVGKKDQSEFINCAAAVTTELAPEELLTRLKAVEDTLGRVREEKWGPRTIDIDILFYDGLVIDTAGLRIPHPEAHLRRFVLEPLCEIAPGLVHPVLGVSITSLLENLEDSEKVVKAGGPSTLFPQ